ncbi:MAG: hypothetical protein AAGA90_11885 [Actinomycetota bacterium]
MTMLLLAGGFVVARALRTTTTEISASEAIERFESSSATAADGYGSTPESAAPAAEAASGDAASAIADSTTATDTEESAAEPTATDSEETAAEPTADEIEAAPLALPLPEPGVYPIALTGSEQLALATGADRTYPAEGFVTVTPAACGVDVRTDLIVERWQSIEFCETEGGVELGTERIFHSFFGQDDLLERECAASPLSVEASAWLCESSSSIADRSVTAEFAVREVAGERRDVVVFVTELVQGDHPDNVESIEFWVDVETGLPVYESRIYDFVLDTPLGDAGYTEDYVWEITSLESIG